MALGSGARHWRRILNATPWRANNSACGPSADEAQLACIPTAWLRSIALVKRGVSYADSQIICMPCSRRAEF